MVTITIDEFVNGFGIKAYDPKEGYMLNEFHEERLEAWKALQLLATDVVTKELEGRKQNASSM